MFREVGHEGRVCRLRLFTRSFFFLFLFLSFLFSFLSLLGLHGWMAWMDGMVYCMDGGRTDKTG